MGKKNQGSNFGRAIIKDRFRGHHHKHESQLHTSELNDGYDWGRLNLQSVTEQNNLEDFLATAELAGTEFLAEKLNISVINPEKHTGLLTAEQEEHVKQTQESHKTLLRVPRRPAWDQTTSPEELDQRERQSFLEWRKELSQLQEVEGLLLTPFEKNLEFWRQLWRVIERSDIVVQIVDSRNPLLFRSEDLEIYVKEINPDKINMILINKADYLTAKQREYWAQYFDSINVKVAFWSAVMETERCKKEAAEDQGHSCDEEKSPEGGDVEDYVDESSEDEKEHSDNVIEQEKTREMSKPNVTDSEHDLTREMSKPNVTHSEHELTADNKAQQDLETTDFSSESSVDLLVNRTVNKLHVDGSQHSCSDVTSSVTPCSCPHSEDIEGARSGCWRQNNPAMLTGDELLHFFKSLCNGKRSDENVTTVGLVGYPNVGKSSSINALLQVKKVPVSATPGRTKHFQTLYVDKDVLLCDCPGLVMPSFLSTKADMVVSGILSIDQMRDFVPPTSLVCRHMPKEILEATYGIILPLPQEGEDPDRPPTSHELGGAYACMRGFMTHKGIPDYQRAARQILKDYVTGKLLYCHSPPGVSVEDFLPTGKPRDHAQLHTSRHTAQSQSSFEFQSDMDKNFFHQTQPRIGSKGPHGILGYVRKEGFTLQHSAGDGSSSAASQYGSQGSIVGKPWKKHGNRNKKEKLRRLHKQLDA